MKKYEKTIYQPMEMKCINLGLLRLVFILMAVSMTTRWAWGTDTGAASDQTIPFMTFGSGPASMIARLWVPDGVAKYRGVIITAPGQWGDSRWATAQWNPDPLQVVAARHGFCLLGFTCTNAQGSSTQDDVAGLAHAAGLAITAINQYASLLSHPELTTAPIATYGFSDGSGYAINFAEAYPQRTIAFAHNKGGYSYTGLSRTANAWQVPGVLCYGSLDIPPYSTYSRMDYIKSGFAEDRSANGALWMLIPDWDLGHDGNGYGQNFGALFLDRMIEQRIPQSWVPGTAPALIAFTEGSGWLGDNTSIGTQQAVISPPAEITGAARLQQSWIPTEELAREWRAVATKYPAGRIDPLIPGTPAKAITNQMPYNVDGVATTGFSLSLTGAVSQATWYDGLADLGISAAPWNGVRSFPTRGLHPIYATLNSDTSVSNLAIVAITTNGAFWGDFSTSAPTVTTAGATSISGNGATAYGVITDDGGGQVFVRGVCWSTSPNPTTTNAHTIDGASVATIGNFASTLTGLSSNTIYHYRAYATNCSGTSYGADLTFATTVMTSPRIALINPSTGVVSGGMTATISGSNLTGTSSVTFAGVSATNVTVVNPTLVTCVVPPHAFGAVDVVLTSISGTATQVDAFAYIGYPNGPGSGITRDWWLNITGGNGIADLTTNASYPNNPSGTEVLTDRCEAPYLDWADNYGQRLRGYFVAPVTGPYVFSIAGDDVADLWLSPNMDPAAAVKIATTSGWTASRQWTKYPSQQSSPVTLTAGGKYYVLALHREVSGGDNLAVGVTLPGGVDEMPIPSHRLIPFASFWPAVTSVSPDTALSVGGATVIITGSGFTETSSVTFDGVVATNVVSTPTRISCTVPAHAVGSVPVVVSASSGSTTANGLFAYTYPTGPGGGITHEWWLGIPGTTIASLTSDVRFPNVPTGAEVITSLFEAPSSFADDYGQRMHGYFIAPASGQYTFYVASDDVAELWLSPSVDPAAAVKIAWNDTWTYPRNWNQLASQVSAPVSLMAGNQYYIRALHKESNGAADNLAVGVTLPGGVNERPIPGHRLLPWAVSVPAPTITSIYPAMGTTAGGTQMTLGGHALGGGMIVTLGGANAAVLATSDTQLVVSTPTHVAGVVDVVVTTVGGSTTRTGSYTYLSTPAITGLSLTSGPIAGGTSVTITGANLTGATVMMGGTAGTVISTTATQVVLSTPAHAAGAVDVEVTTSQGSAISAHGFTFTYPAGPGTGVVRDWWTGIAGLAIGTLTSNAAYPANPTGSQVLTTAFETPSNWGDYYGQRVYGYFIAPATGLYSFSIAADDASELWLSPSQDPAAAVLLARNTLWAPPRAWGQYGSQTSMSVSLTAGSRYYLCALHVESTGGDNLAVGVTLPGGVEERPIPAHRLIPLAPTVVSVSPTVGSNTGGTLITITGTNLTGTSVITIGGTAATSVTMVSPTQVTCVLPPRATGGGTVDLVLTTPGGTVTVTGGITYLGPAITDITPTNGWTGGGASVNITGTGLTGATVTMGGITATVLSTSATQVTVASPAHAAGAIDVAVTTPAGTAIWVAGYTYISPTAPIITSITPTMGPSSGGAVVTITGTNLSGATVTMGGAVATVTSSSATQLMVVPPTHIAGVIDVTVTTSGESATSMSAYRYMDPPTITLVSPANGSPVGGTVVTITGTNLTGTTAITFGGMAATAVTAISDVSVTCWTPPMAIGMVSVDVVAPGGTTTSGDAYSYTNTAPFVASRLYTVVTGGTARGALSGSDADGDALTYAVVTPPLHGTVTIDAVGNFIYQTNLKTAGLRDSFTVKANDGLDDSPDATISMYATVDLGHGPHACGIGSGWFALMGLSLLSLLRLRLKR